MNDTIETPRLVLRVELSCFYCGHSYGEVRVPVGDRPTYRDLRKAVEAIPDGPKIAWDAHGAPRCPRCHGTLEDANLTYEDANPLCGDRITMMLGIGDGDTVREVAFTGRGCAISQASASLMTMKLKGKSRAEVLGILGAFHNLVTDQGSEAPKTLGDLRVMRGVRSFPQRVKCAMLAWRAVEQALEQGTGEGTVSTEPA